jgi:CubicO group peptidase (beta-lactamase class C family)
MTMRELMTHSAGFGYVLNQANPPQSPDRHERFSSSHQCLGSRCPRRQRGPS